MALGRGYALPFIAGKQGGGGAGGAYGLLWQEAINANVPPLTAEDFDAGQGSCLFTRGKSLYDAQTTKPSLLIVPQMRAAGKLAVDIPSPVFFDVTRATTATRVNSSGLIESVASGVPRLDWYATPAAQDAAATGCPALLVEASGQNGILNSADTTTNWTLGANLSSGAIDVIGVSGNNITVAVSGSNIGVAAGRIGRSSNNVALASGSTYTISFFVKTTGTHTIGGYYALITGAAAGDLGAGFNVSGSFSSGSIFNTAGTTNRIRRVEQWGTDVYRCSETFTMTASGTLTSFFLAPLAGVTSSSNSAAGSQLGFAAPQIELGVFPTSFIPTTTASVTRNADLVNASGSTISGLIGQTEGTIYAEVDVRTIADTKGIIQIDDGTINNRIALLVETSPNRLTLAITSGSVLQTVSGSITTGTHKIAVSYASGSQQVYLDGSLLISGTVPLPTVTLNNFSIGSRISSGVYGRFFNDRIRAAAIYTTRLSNDELAQLTT